MTQWRMARSLDTLLNEVNRSAPARSKATDGGIGDAAHATRTSDHNPWVKDRNGIGVVRARDFTDDPAGGLHAAALARHVAGLLGRHPALGTGAYVIWDHRIISTAQLAAGWRPYTGANPHTAHVHISVGLTGYDDTSAWGWPPREEDDTMTPEQDKILRSIAARLAKLEAAEKRRDEKERERDKAERQRAKNRHQKLVALLKDVPEATRDAVLAELEDELASA